MFLTRGKPPETRCGYLMPHPPSGCSNPTQATNISHLDDLDSSYLMSQPLSALALCRYIKGWTRAMEPKYKSDVDTLQKTLPLQGPWPLTFTWPASALSMPPTWHSASATPHSWGLGELYGRVIGSPLLAVSKEADVWTQLFRSWALLTHLQSARSIN